MMPLQRRSCRSGLSIATIVTGLGALGVSASIVQAQCEQTYNAALGTPPHEQGWAYTGGTWSVINGELHLTSGVPDGAYFIDLADTSWTWAEGLECEAFIKVISSDYVSADGIAMRAGFMLAGIDSTLRYYAIGIGSNRVFLTNHGNVLTDNGFVDLPFDSTDGFHRYTLRAGPAGGQLLIDGVLRATVPTREATGTQQGLWWADGTSYAGATVNVRSYRYTRTPLQQSGAGSACLGATVSLSASPVVIQPTTYRWQWQTDAADGWSDLVDGVNTRGGEAVFTANGANTVTVQLNGFTLANVPSYGLRFRSIVTGSCGVVTSSVIPVAISTADFAQQGGIIGSDGVLDNNDFVVFIDLFFAHDARADLGVQGGGLGSDGMFNNNDFVAFVALFFDGCH